MESLQEILLAVTAFVRVRYLEAALAAGIPKREFKDWAHSMANLGVAVALEKFEEYDDEKGPFLGYAIFRTKDAVRASLRNEHRYRKALKALALVPNGCYSHDGGLQFYLSLEEAEEILQLLSEEQQRVLSLSYQGYSVGEITQILRRKSINTVKSLLRRARKNSQRFFLKAYRPRDDINRVLGS